MTIDDDDGNNDNEEIVEPIVEMEFDSLDALRLFFKRYAFDMGFGWKVRTSKKDKNGDVYYVVIVCSREGTPTSKGPSLGRTFPTQKANCQAKINALKNEDGKWVIKK
ncbi:hypothetical protein PIB30_114635, partial [Stylosanthes scabra]|nr:hypothetical protein [Stylosanthes scabra]